MSRYYMTDSGPVTFTPKEEADWDAMEAAWAARVKDRFNAQAKQDREAAYKAEADPLFFKSQRGDATQAEWQAKVAEIKARFPYQE